MDSEPNRRTVLKSAGAGIALAAGFHNILRPAWATPAAMEAVIEGRVGGKPVSAKGIEVELPIIAEDGANVPVTVIVDSPMTEADYIKAIYIFAPENPTPEIVGFQLTPACGRAKVTINVRLAKTQKVTALAEASDGSFRRADKMVKVTLGGCGG